MDRYKVMLLGILLLASITRLWRLDYPKGYYFDEVYNAFTTVEMTKGERIAFEWFHQSPVEGTAYGWTHPPLAKMLAGVGVLIWGANEFGWRIVNAIIGVRIIYLVYRLGVELLGNRKYALLAALFASLDGLLLVQSRINMNDIVATFFVLSAFAAFVAYQKAQTKFNLLRLGLNLGLLVAAKWTGLYAIMVFGTWIGFANVTNFKAWPRIVAALLVVPAVIYILSYSQYFVLGGSWSNFVELQKQMWWYNTNLTATHTYQSAWWSWPLNLRPVWYFVDYSIPDQIANIYAMGNPILWWLAIPASLYVMYQAFVTKSWKLWVIVCGLLAFWLPWARAPRIMFIYHYLPTIPFLCIALAFSLSKLPRWATLTTGILVVGSFVYFLPHWLGIHVPTTWANQYFWTASWK